MISKCFWSFSETINKKWFLTLKKYFRSRFLTFRSLSRPLEMIVFCSTLGGYKASCASKKCFWRSQMITKCFWSIFETINKKWFLTLKNIFYRNFWPLGTSPNLPKMMFLSWFCWMLSLWGSPQLQEHIFGCSSYVFRDLRHQLDPEPRGFDMKPHRECGALICG